MTVTSRSVNKPGSAEFGLFCNPESRRVEGFSQALGRTLRQHPQLIPWQWVLEGRPWEELLQQRPNYLRLESPGRNWTIEQQLLVRGADLADEESANGWRRLPAAAASALANDPGRLLPLRQWFLAWRRILLGLADWAKRLGLDSNWLCPPADVICQFDKPACQKELEKAGLPVPPALGVPRNFDELWEMMRQSGTRRIFLKPAHGSSASGVVAFESRRTDLQAFSTVSMISSSDGTRLYNQRRIQTYRGAQAVRQLVDAVCAERCLAQVWIPKAGLSGGPFDLRVVVIGGRARQVMVRLGKGPMTNSQLLGGKGEVAVVRERMGPEAWERMLALGEQAMTKCFPASLYAGLDILVEPDFRTARILEINSFGDLLPRLLHEGRDTYTWEVEAAVRRRKVQVSTKGA